VLRRLVPAVAAVLALGSGAGGCADDLSPAARVGDLTITHDELMDEVEQWTESPRLVELFLGAPPAPTEGRFDAQLVDVVLSNRISFEVYRAEFEARGLEVDDGLREEIRVGIFQDPADSAAVLEQLDPTFGDRLIEDIARQFVVQSALSDQLIQFEDDAFSDIEVNPRYGRWDAASRSVVPPEGPRQAVSDDLTVEP
jgi:hypothetical protein